MREAAAMAQLCEEDCSKAEMLSAEVTLSNLRCLMSPEVYCSPPPCPPPSSTSSSASSSPRPDVHPDGSQLESPRTPSPCQHDTRQRPDWTSEAPNPSTNDNIPPYKQQFEIVAFLPNETQTVQVDNIDGSSLVQIIAEAHEQMTEAGTKNTEQFSARYIDEDDAMLITNIIADSKFCSSSSSCASSESDDDDDNDSVTSVISREVVTWESLSPRAPLAAEEDTDEEEGARVDKAVSGAQNQAACGSAALEAAAATAAAAVVEAETVVVVQSEVHARGSILSNVLEAREEFCSLANASSSEVSGLESGGESSVAASRARNDVSLESLAPVALAPAPALAPTTAHATNMRQKASGSSSAAPNNEGSVQQHQQHQHQDHHQSSNNNSDCPLQCNGMVSECCWNGDCVEARTTKNNLKPAIKLNTEKRSENGKRRVTFNETLNKFFDADYVILVGEDCNGDETTRLVSMCKKSNCQPGGNFDLNFPELCPFEPPLEYIDQVTLSPPEGYKDVLGAARSAQDDESESESSGEARSEDEDGGQSPVCEQCSACSACASQQQQQQQQNQQQNQQQQLQQQQQQQRYIVETITLTTVTERRIVREANEADEPRLSGILKGGKLWKNCEGDSASTPSEDGETSSRRSVRFCEDELEKKSEEDDEHVGNEDEIDDEIIEEPSNAETKTDESDNTATTVATTIANDAEETKVFEEKTVSIKEQVQQESNLENNTELTLTFRLGSSILLSDKLPANSAVRQLFPDSEAQQRLLGVATSPGTAEGDSKDVSESDVPSLPSPGQTGPAGSSSDDEAAARTSTQIRRTIERNALRRSLLRCSEPIRRRPPPRAEENSLVERIRQLTCDVDDDDDNNKQQNDQLNERSSPPGQVNKNQPSTYKKLTELFSRRERCHSESSPSSRPEPLSLPADNSCCWLMVDPVRPPPDFARSAASLPPHTVSPTTSLPPPGNFVGPKTVMSRMSVSAEARKQFLSTLGERETPPDGSANVGDRASMAETTYSLEDIDEALGECACPNNGQLASNQPPDVVATAQEHQQRNEPVDELALFVQRDMGRIERIKKRYSLTDDDQDDYGFSRRPSVRGIKPRFGSTTEILQQIQLQLQPPALACPSRAGSHLTWPYATEPVAAASPASSPSEPPVPRRRQQGLPAPRGANGLPVLPEDSYYATAPVQDYRYLEYSTQNGGGYMYASTGNLYPRNEMVPYNPRLPQQSLPNCDSPPPCVVRNSAVNAVQYSPQTHPQHPNAVYGTVTRRSAGVPAPVHYSNGTLPHPGYVARNGGRMPAMSYAQQSHARSDSPQRMYHRPAPNYYPSPAAPAVAANGRYYPSPQQGYNITPKNYPQPELPSPSQRTMSPVPASSPTRAAKFERGAPEGASASPGFAQDSYATRMEQSGGMGTLGSPAQGPGTAAPPPTSVYYAMNV